MTPGPDEDRERQIEDLKRQIDERCEDEGRQDFVDALEKMRGEDLRRGPDAEPEPTPGEADVTTFVIDDLKRRSNFGKRKYGTALQTFNGRDALKDLYAELLDGCCYLRQRIEEEKTQGWNDPLMPGHEPPAEEPVLVASFFGSCFVASWNAADRCWRCDERGRRAEGTSWRPLPSTP